MRLANGYARPFVLPIAAFALAIAAGALLLHIPLFRNGEVSWIDALFVSTSAVCVTGLSPFNVFEIYNRSGQIVILLLMQLGGIGILSLTTLAGLLIHHRVAFTARIAVEQGLFYNPRFSLRNFLLRVTLTVFLLESMGAGLLWFYSPGENRFFNSIFLSVSAFCNAGFAPWGDSLEKFRDAPGLNIVIMSLIILGGLGFFVLDELGRKFCSLLKKGPKARLSFYSRLVLGTSFWLALGGASILFLFGCINPDFSDFSLSERLCSAFFESVSCRTAGFDTVSQSRFSSASLLLVIFLMFIGGSPGSCAGGLKTTTFRVLVAFMFATFRGRNQASTLGRAFGWPVLSKALLLLAFSLHIVFAASFFILLMEQGATPHDQAKPFFDIFFEVVSAFCTVGLSLGITPNLAEASKLALCFLMFIGKLGPIWLLAAMQGFQTQVDYRYPEESIPVG